jgi:hypothetical protein
MWQELPATPNQSDAGADDPPHRMFAPGWRTDPSPGNVGARTSFRPVWRRYRFDYSRTGPMTTPGQMEHRFAVIPLWFPPLLAGAGAVPGIVACARRRRRHFRAVGGLCQRCGYDLRASEERCPECGERIPAANQRDSNKTAPPIKRS